MKKESPVQSFRQSSPIQTSMPTQSPSQVNRVTFNYQSHYLPTHQLTSYPSLYQSKYTPPQHQYSLGSQKVYAQQAPHYQSYGIQQNQILNENPPVPLRLPYPTNVQRRQVSEGLGLPKLPVLAVPQVEQEKSDLRRQTKKNDTAWDLCCILPWILAFLLLVALIVVIILLASKSNTHNQVVVPEPTYLTTPCPLKSDCGVQKNVEPVRPSYVISRPDPDSVDPIEWRPETSSYPAYVPPTSRGGQGFYLSDHTNYRFLHLRRNSEIDKLHK